MEVIMQKKIILPIVTLAIITLVMTSLLYAASGKISGTIRDAKTHDALSGANVVIEGIWRDGKTIPLNVPRGAAADKDGFYYIINIPPDHYVIKAMMMGYKTERITNVRVEFNRTITVNFFLKKAVLKGEAVTVTAEREVIQPDISSSQLIIDKQQTEHLPVNDIQQVINLSPGVSVNNFNNQISIRGGGSDQVMAYLDGFAMKNQIFNIPLLSYNRTSIKEITIQTGGFSAEYGDLRSGLIDVVTEDGGKNYSFSLDARYAPPGYKYDGPKKYIEDKPYLTYGSDFSMDSLKLAQMFTWWEDRFVGWPSYSKGYLMDTDSTNDMTPNQRRELWKWRHRGRKEGYLPDYIIDATLSGPIPGTNIPIIGSQLAKMNFMASYRDNYRAYEHPAQRNHFGENNSIFKLTYRIRANMRMSIMGMISHQSGMANMEDDFGTRAFVQRTGGGGSYNDTNNPLGDITNRNLGIDFVHTLSPSTFYEIRINRLWTNYNFRHGHLRDSTLVKHIPGEYYIVEDDSLLVHGLWDKGSGRYIQKDTLLTKGDRMWCPDVWENESANGWPSGGAGNSHWDQPGKYDLNSAAVSSEHSNGWSTTARADLTHQAGKYHLFKTGIYFDESMINRNWKHITNAINDEWHEVKYKAVPLYYAAYFQDRIEIKGLIGNFGVRAEVFDANSQVISPDNPFDPELFKENFWTRKDSLKKSPSKKYFRLSPRLGISHPMTATSKIFFNYGHAYSTPPNYYRYGFRPRTYNWSNPIWIGNPNLKPFKTVQYELGYEQVLFHEYLIHSSVYYKDITDQVGGRVSYFEAYSPNVNAFYFSWDNNNFAEILGWEFRLYKQVGKYFSGWLQTEFIGKKSAQIGFSQKYIPSDPNHVSVYSKFSYPDDIMWKWVPSLLANVDFHLPSDWGPKIMGMNFLGGWRVNAILSWRQGEKFTWNPARNPYVRDNLQWADSYSDDYYVSRLFHFRKSKATFYLEIQNLFNKKRLNVGVLDGLSINPGSEIYQYYASLKKGDRVGDYKQSYIRRPKDKPGENYIYRAGGPVRVFIGLKFDLLW